MKHSYDRPINDKKEYEALFPSNHYEKAYERAAQTREFEIKLYWERAKYFWAFITTIYVAYYNVLISIYDKAHGKFPLLVLSGLGLFFAIAWILVAKGSKHWQENWEHHIALLEDKVTGPLFKIYKANSFSVSKVNLIAGYVVAFCAAGLFAYEGVEFCRKSFVKEISFAFYIGILVVAAIGIIAFIFNARGNVKTKEKEIVFDLFSVKGK
ncbi:hypothetical protein SAMN02745108_01136 [Fibrobacter intestinalis]|uniref:Uncharacterized protein n=2 Tax=Fibrobacteraceae TaxID=204431 RepID=A0A1T4M562_9BACT|nr:hypothetical protein BGW94_1059 [Fibrobacter sp. NR9]SJZ62062.1 hypothetical protein SAMN02745108_01136 [Fibrobacter intestinalis]